jgi:glycosyltransferase involved in cell wall biosynthesis
VASRWMLDMARASPMAVGARLHYIPFGVDLSRFKPRDQAAAKARFGVLPDRVVVAARGFISPYKGVTELAAALERIQTPLCVLSLHDSGGFDRLIGRHQVIGLDWTDDEDALIDAYAATDFFVMPSMGEAFGMMAVEAMACGKPVVVFEGTALPDVTFAPEAGIAVPMRDVQGLADAVQHLVDDAPDRLRRGKRARELAEQHYSAELYADRLTALYQAVAKGQSNREAVAVPA